MNLAEAPAQYVRDISAHHTAFIAGSIIVSAGTFLVIPAMIGAMRLAPGRQDSPMLPRREAHPGQA